MRDPQLFMQETPNSLVEDEGKFDDVQYCLLHNGEELKIATPRD
jgi:hypothetical protein